jgi:hypothetical protein
MPAPKRAAVSSTAARLRASAGQVQDATDVFALKRSQTLLKQRLTGAQHDLFQELTGLRLHAWWHKPAAELQPGALLNNVEQVYIANPVTNGTYTVTVTHKETLANSQWVSILVSGNVAQQPPSLTFNQILQTGTNTMAVGWPAVVGGQYQVQVNTNLATTNWVNTGGIISARLTNVVAQVSMPGTQAFYRLIQLP